MKCIDCNGKWDNDFEVSECPFCKAGVPQSNEEIMLRIVERYSIEVYNKVDDFVYLISDFLAHDDKLCRLLQIIVSYGGSIGVHKLKNCLEADFSTRFEQLLDFLEDQTFIPKQRLMPAVDLLLAGIGKSQTETALEDFRIDRGILIKYIGAGGDVVIPRSVTSIGTKAFANSKTVTSVFVPNSVKSIGSNSFVNCINMISISLSSSIKTIGVSAFENCSRLGSITIPNLVKTIEKNSFRGCTSMTSVTISNSVTLIDDFAFVRCNTLPMITIPSSVTAIGVGAFADCASLTKVNIPPSVRTIGGSAFMRCEKLGYDDLIQIKKLTVI